MKVEMLNGGRLTAGAGIWRQGDELERPMEIPVPAYLIETDHERVLVDTGLHPAAAADVARHYGKPELASVFGLELDRSVADQVDPTTLTRVVLTHLHFDHAGGLALLPPSVQRVLKSGEWDAGHDRAAVARNCSLPADYAAAEERVTLVDGRHDLLGDG